MAKNAAAKPDAPSNSTISPEQGENGHSANPHLPTGAQPPRADVTTNSRPETSVPSVSAYAVAQAQLGRVAESMHLENDMLELLRVPQRELIVGLGHRSGQEGEYQAK